MIIPRLLWAGWPTPNCSQVYFTDVQRSTSEVLLAQTMTSLEEAQALKKRPTNIVHAETEPGPWSLKKGVKFGYTEIDDPTSAPNLAETAPCEESQNLGHILDIFCSSCQFDSMRWAFMRSQFCSGIFTKMLHLGLLNTFVFWMILLSVASASRCSAKHQKRVLVSTNM